MNNPYNIYYDMQRNSFYRINKTDGTSAHTYSNGQNVPYFKPNVTGFQYNRRKSVADADYFTRKQSPKSISPFTKTNKLAKINFSTINTDTSSIYQHKHKISETLHSERSRNSKGFEPNSTKYLHSTLSERKQQSDFQQKMRKFQQIASRKVKDNHSPRKDLNGSVQKIDIIDKLCITKNNFTKDLNTAKQLQHIKKKQIPNLQTIQNTKDKTKSKNKIFKKDNNLSQQFSVQKQIKQEKIHNLLILGPIIKRDRQKSIERDKLRKQNMKKLEKEMLQRNSKLQNKIFKQQY